MSNVSASRAISADEMRMTNYRNLLEQKNDLQIKDIEDRHTQDVERIITLNSPKKPKPSKINLPKFVTAI
jgi:hypothetical protein